MDTLLKALPTWAAASIVVCLALFYFIETVRIVRKRPQHLWIPALVLLVAATAFYHYMYVLEGTGGFFPPIFLALSDAVNLFLFRVNTTYGLFFSMLYRADGDGAAIAQANVLVQNRMACLMGLYACSVWTTSLLIVHFLTRRLASRVALAWKSRKGTDKGIFLFLGVCQEHLSVARSLGAGRDIVFVDLPDRDSMPDKLSLSKMIQGMRNGTDVSVQIRQRIPGALVLKAKKPLAQCTGTDLFRELGLGRLRKWAQNPATVILMLSERQAENLSALQMLSSYQAQLYCQAAREGLALRMELASESGNIHIVDASFLATKILKLRSDLYPIRLMDVARNEAGEPLGYVNGEFNACICGFGEGGQGALSFLYEFGAFPGRDKQPNRFLCDIMDRNMDSLEGLYKVNHPDLDKQRVRFLQNEIGSAAFWEYMHSRIHNLNYVYIALGEDRRSVQFALELLEFAFRNRGSMDRFLILVQLDHPDTYRELISYYNRNFGEKESIKTLGDMEEIWTWNNISNEGFSLYAKTFFNAYSSASEEPVSWEDRARQVMAKDTTNLSKKLELQRKTGQEFTNYFHAHVKALICPARLWQDPQIAADIPLRDVEGVHYLGNDAEAGAILDYLAVGEHIRWVASHQILGYRPGPKKQEDLKTHPDIRPYYQLSEYVKHFDWIVVKTSLEMLKEEEASK